MVLTAVAYTAFTGVPTVCGARRGAMAGDKAVAPEGAEVVTEARTAAGRLTVTPAADPDRPLVAAAAAGDTAAFEILLRRYETRIVNYVQAILRDPGEAEDVAQETFIRAYRSLRRFRGDSAFKTWLYTIATNTARTALDRRGRRERVADVSLDDDTRGPAAERLSSDRPDAEAALVTRDAIDRALASLTDEMRQAVVLRDVEGLDYKEIADVLDIPIGTVESRIFRARKRLRALLAPARGGAVAGREG